MGAVWYWWRTSGRRTWKATVVVALLCGILGAVALGALAGARRTESAYGRYLRSINASDVMVNVPSPDTALIRKVAALPGVRSSAAWVGLDANPVVHGRVNEAFETDSLAGSLNGELFTQDTMTVVKGHLPPLGATGQIVMTASVARLFGVGVGGEVTYQFENNGREFPVPTGYASYRVAAIVDLPPVLVDQFDQTSGAFSALPSTLAIDLDPGTPAGAVVHRIVAADPGGNPGAVYQVPRVLGAAIANAGQMGDQPLALAVAVAVAVLVSLAATVVASARRRRRELAVLKSLGLTRRQMTGVLAWHTVTLLVVALVLGLPIGIAAGHWTWAAFAASLGVVPVTVVPLLGLVLGLIALLAAGTALTALPAAIAARAPTALALRHE